MADSLVFTRNIARIQGLRSGESITQVVRPGAGLPKLFFEHSRI